MIPLDVLALRCAVAKLACAVLWLRYLHLLHARVIRPT